MKEHNTLKITKEDEKVFKELIKKGEEFYRKFKMKEQPKIICDDCLYSLAIANTKLSALQLAEKIEQENLKKCQDSGYKGIYWDNKPWYWDCYKYKENGEMLISHEPLD
jgi:hypothetical protein